MDAKPRARILRKRRPEEPQQPYTVAGVASKRRAPATTTTTTATTTTKHRDVKPAQLTTSSTKASTSSSATRTVKKETSSQTPLDLYYEQDDYPSSEDDAAAVAAPTNGHDDDDSANTDDDEDDDDDDDLRDYIALHHKGGGKLSSRNTLAQLPLLTPKAISDLIQADAKNNHARERAQLLASYERKFESWFMQALAGFNLLFYGYGSKKVLLERFGEVAIAARGHPFIVINGFFSGLSLKHILGAIVSAHFELEAPSADPLIQCNYITEQLEKLPDVHIFLILHNIDGEVLRSPQTQMTLSRLAAIERLHMFASVDNINAQLQWDHSMLGNFQWVWHHTPTFETYEYELQFQSQIMCDGAQGTVGTRGASLVLKSLTKRARDAFRLLANTQLQNKPPMSLKELFSQMLNEYFASSEQELEKYIKEMRDHKIVRTIKRGDGTEVLALALQDAAVRQLLDDIGTE